MDWVRVDNKLPPEGDCVIVAVGGAVGIGGYSPEFGWWLTGGDFDDAPVSYWMSLPEAPNVKLTGAARLYRAASG